MKELKFVDVGEGITEGHVQKWLVKDGDEVKEDQPIVQIETDKAVVNLPAPIGGRVKIKAKENTDVKVGDYIALIGTAEELQETQQKPQAQPPDTGQPANPPPVQPPPAIQAKPTAPPWVDLSVAQPAQKAAPPPPKIIVQQQPPEHKEILATPYVRKLAHDMNIDISRIVGTGPEGRVVENDIRGAAMKQRSADQPKPAPKFSEVLEESHANQVERVPMSQTRKAIARNMELSATIPRAVHMDYLNATHLYDMTKREKEIAAKHGVKLTFLPFIIKAVVDALKENPRFNSSYDHERSEIIMKKYYNIGLAAESSGGLKVVVIKDADKKSILDIARKIQELHKKIQDNTIAIEEMRDSTFTITNIGSLGGGFLSVPMINYPEVGILGVHLIREWPVVINGEVKVGKVLPFSIAFDHRVVDGAEAVLFGNALIKYLEDPEFLEMLG